MGLLDGLEKLINEHGSAVILKERIALANDKYAALEKKLSDSELRAKKLESENDCLRLDLGKAEEKNRNLEEQLSERHGNRLEKIREELLQMLAVHPGVTDEQLSNAMKQNLQIIKFHLTELKKSQLVSLALFVGSPALWSLAHEGRAYLISHGLLS
ncbi:MAG: hypothetical protein HY278_04370 [candidate division NC10 bacterium]|nr:hypothetical protein [candidate division NC10 bacterium]